MVTAKILCKTPVSYYGGKQTMLRDILPRIPDHNLYCEPFLGGGAVFWAKKPSPIEVLNDRNGEITNFYRVLKTGKIELECLVKTTLHSRDAYRDANVIYQYPHLFDDVKRAWAVWVSCNQSYGSIIGGGWSYQRKGKNHCATKIHHARERDLSILTNRLDRVSVESDDALRVIERFDNEEAFFYLDPPYPGTNQGHYGGYTFGHFAELLSTCAKLKGKFLLSNFPSEMLTKAVKEHGWHRIDLDKSMCMTNNKTRKTEVLIANYPI